MSHLVRRRGDREAKKSRTPRLIPPNPPQQWNTKKAVEHLSLSVGESEIPPATFMRVRNSPLLTIDVMMHPGPGPHFDQAPKPVVILSFEQTIDHKWKVSKPGDKRPVFLPHHPTSRMLLCFLQQEDRLGAVTAHLHKLSQLLSLDEETIGLMDTFLLLRGKPEAFLTSLIARIRSWLVDERGRRWFY